VNVILLFKLFDFIRLFIMRSTDNGKINFYNDRLIFLLERLTGWRPLFCTVFIKHKFFDNYVPIVKCVGTKRKKSKIHCLIQINFKYILLNVII